MGTKKKKEKAKKPKVWSPTVKQQKFVNAYEGNATEAARLAGYKGTDGYLRLAGYRLITNDNILALIEKRQEAEKSAKVADRTERAEILSSILRNNKAYEVEGLTLGVDVAEELETGKTKFVKISAVDRDRIKAADTLNKMDALYVQKQEHSGIIKTGTTFADGIKQVRDQMKGSPEEEKRLLGEVIDE